jgi:hypothetical protein
VTICFLLLTFIPSWVLVGCASYKSLTSEEIRQMELEDVGKLCYSCVGPHATECDEMYLKNHTRMDMERRCSGRDDP